MPTQKINNYEDAELKVVDVFPSKEMEDKAYLLVRKNFTFLRHSDSENTIVSYLDVLSPKEKALFLKYLEESPFPAEINTIHFQRKMSQRFPDDDFLLIQYYKEGYAYGKMFLEYKSINQIICPTSPYSYDNRPWIKGFQKALEGENISEETLNAYGLPPKEEGGFIMIFF